MLRCNIYKVHYTGIINEINDRSFQISGFLCIPDYSVSQRDIKIMYFYIIFNLVKEIIFQHISDNISIANMKR